MKKQIKTYITRGIQEKGLDKDIPHLLERFFEKEWGDVSKEDAKYNNLALATEDRILASYNVRGTKVWIIMDAGHEIVTVLLPDEY